MKLLLETVKYWHRKIIFAALVILTGISLSCSKSNTLVRILGTWERVNVINMNAEEKEDWLFDVDDVFVITRYLKSNPDSLTYRNEGRYSVDVKWFKRYVNISGFTGGDSYMNAEWEIVKTNKNILILVSDKTGGLEIREFTKKKF